jgi:hypothetical protein
MKNTTKNYSCNELFTRICAIAHMPNSPYRNRARILSEMYLNGKANYKSNKLSKNTFKMLGNIMIANAERHHSSKKEGNYV